MEPPYTTVTPDRKTRSNSLPSGFTTRRGAGHISLDAGDAASEAVTMKAMALRIPRGLAANCHKAPERAAWLDRLTDVLRDLERRWSLTLDTPLDGEEVSCSYVAAGVRADGTRAVLKIGMPHMEGEHEIHGLRFWDGDPTVRLLMADDDLGAMLLERCEPGTVLRALPESEQDVVISGLLRRLWRMPSAPHPFRPLSALMDYWSEQTLADVDRWPDTGLVQEGLALLKELPRTAASD